MKVPGILIGVLAVVIGAVAVTFNCQAEGLSLTLANGNQVPMKCFWTAMAEIAVTVPLVVVGAMMAFSQRKEGRRILGIMGGILGAFAMLVPTVLIGVCANPAHDCNRIVLPTTLLAGTLIIALSLGTLIISERRVEAMA